MSASHASLLVQSMIANGIYNLDGARFRKASLDTRAEGWTEIWGGKEEDANRQSSKEEKDDNKQTKTGNEGIVLVFEDTTSSVWAEVEDKSICVLLTQYRPAWFEQMVLKMAKIPYIVVNSTHHCNEATGQLPYLTDYYQPSSTSSASSTSKQLPPMLVGRHHPTNLIERCHFSSIIAYLQEYRNVDLDGTVLTSDHQRALSLSFLHLIQSDLRYCVDYLRYEDQDAWEQVYRKQYIQASCSKHHRRHDSRNINWFLQLRGRFQAMVERSVERRRLVEYTRNISSLHEAVKRAKDSYHALERQIIAVNQDSTRQAKYLLGTDRPAMVDAALFAHLADALCDVHLIVALSSFPILVEYFQGMYQRYFSSTKDSTTERTVSFWEEWNERQNLENAFQQIPILGEKQLSKYGTFKDAINLMHTLSLQKQELKEVLEAIKGKRDDEPWPQPRKATESLLYRWCMGGDMENVTNEAAAEKENNPIRKKLSRDQIRNDQRWISGVAAASMIAILFLRASASDE
jgi:hypothetical protein